MTVWIRIRLVMLMLARKQATQEFFAMKDLLSSFTTTFALGNIPRYPTRVKIKSMR
jgi:hypothetical protein